MKKCILVGLVSTAMMASVPAHASKKSIENAGDHMMFALGIASVAIPALYEDGWENKAWGVGYAVSSQLIAQGITTIGKKTVDKTRPNGNCCESFPSGHATAGFASAGFIHKRYGLEAALMPYIGATFVAYSRVYADKHYVEDVAVGALIGGLTGYYLTEEYNGWNITPTASTNHVGLNFSMDF